MSKLIKMEFKTGDPDKITKFYLNVFGYQLNRKGKHNDFWFEIPEGTGYDMPNSGIKPRSEHLSTFYVSELDRIRLLILENGGNIISESIELPGIGRFMRCEDVGGNYFNIIEPISKV